MYDVCSSDTTFFTAFGKEVDRVFFKVPGLHNLHPATSREWTFQSGSLIVPLRESHGLFQDIVNIDCLSAEQIMGLKKQDLLDRIDKTQTEGNVLHQSRK